VPLSGDPNASTVTFTNDGGNQTQELTQVVTYTELGTFSVQYVDQDNGNQVIPDTGYTSTVTKYGDQITYSTADTIADLEKKGYVLVNNEFDQTGQAFGDSSNGHTYTVTLKHGQVPVTPENPGDPGQPINPDDPDGPKWPAGTAKSDLLEDATQTIHYTGAGKDTPKDSVTPHEGAFTKTVTVDKVTGEIVSQTDFTGDPYTFGTVDTPVVDGYHTEKPTAGGLTATVDNPNPTDTVTYIANGQLIPVDQDGNPIPGTPTTTYTTDPKDPTKVVTEIPDVPGYTPTINGQPVTPGSYTPTDPSGDTTVVYVKNTSVTVEYFDQTTGKVLKTDTLTGLMGGDLNYTTTSTIQDYVAKGYRLVSDQFTDAGTTFTKSNDGKTYVVTLAHTNQIINTDQPGVTVGKKDASQTIHYTGVDGVEDSVKIEPGAFKEIVTIDKVTGQVVSREWTGEHTFPTVKTPIEQGYTANVATACGATTTPDHPDAVYTVNYTLNGHIIPVDEQGNPIPGAPTPAYTTDMSDPTKVTPNEKVPEIPGYVATVSTVTPTDPTQNTKVTYVKKDAALTVLFLDKTTGTTLATVNVDGKYGDQIKFSPAELIQSFEQKGYHLIANEFDQAGTTLGDANNGKTYLIEFDHHTKTITPSDPGQPGQPINPNDPNGPKWPAGTGASDLVKGATQTIHYQGVSGVEDSVTTIKGAFEKTVTVDLVTGKIVSETDFTGQANFETVKTPVVNGYHADKALAGDLTATPDQPNVSDTVTYQANGKVVPVDENGQPIPGADQPTYPTDPSDPTKVLPVPVPAVPGYTTKTTIVTPSDPGANTTVTYEKVVDEAPATPSKPTATPQAKQAPAKEAANQATLPQTGNEDDAPVAVAGGFLAGLMGLLGLLGFKKKQDD